jgi:hypothetical protein
MIRFRRSLALLALAGAACETLTDPALPDAATILTPPPVYARWWGMTEACSGLQRDMSAVTWYVATGSLSISDGKDDNLAGYYSPASNRIVLADSANLAGGVIRHEMLHALLGPSVGGHPRDQFLGRCAGTVDCIGGCLTDAGPPPPPDAAADTVDPSVLELTGTVDPIAPSRAIDDGWFTFTIMATNPRATPIIVKLKPSGDAGPPVSFSWTAHCLPTIAPCGNLGGTLRDERADDAASATRFAAGETKRFVVDFQIGRPINVYWGLPSGAYAFTGYFNGRYPALAKSTPDTVMVGP